MNINELNFKDTYSIPSGLGGIFEAKLEEKGDDYASFKIINKIYKDWDGEIFIFSINRLDEIKLYK